MPLPLSAASQLLSHAYATATASSACMVAGGRTSSTASSTTSSSSWSYLPPSASCPPPLLRTMHSLHSSVDVETATATSSSSSSSSNAETITVGGTSRGGPSSGQGGRPGNNSNGNGDDDFGANFGEAVLVLREDLPALFERDPRWHIYRDDITFRTPSMRYSTGLWKYRLLHKAARLLGNLLYADMCLSLTRMWQPAGNRRQLRVRWCVSGRPRLSLSVQDKPESTEVISTYTFDSKGFIREHQVDNIIPPESPLVQLMEWLVGRLQPGMVPQPQLPIPGLRDGMGSTAGD